MISLEKWMILALLQKLPKNVGDLAKSFRKLPKVQKIAQSGHTDCIRQLVNRNFDQCSKSIMAIQ